MNKNLDYIEDFKKFIFENYDECYEGAYNIRKAIAASTAYYHGNPMMTLYIPKIFTEEVFDRLKNIGETTYKILEKVTKEYLKNPEYRRLFPYPEGAEELILTERGYESVIPICRLDIFFNEDDNSFKFCEINTDGTSAMNEDWEMNNILEHNIAFQEYSKTHKTRSIELYDSWVKAFLNIYNDWKCKKSCSLCADDSLAENIINIEKNNACHISETGKKPFVAIVDFTEDATPYEFKHFKKTFEDNGCECEIAEIRDLRYEGGRLISPEGKEIDAVYRRAVTTDILSNIDDVKPFIDAVKDNTVCCIGNFCTQVAHNKALFHIIRREETKRLLTDEENEFVEAHFPFTGYLDSNDTGTNLTIDDIKNTKDRWILKPLDLYGAREVAVGSDFSKDGWSKKVDELKDNGFIFQEYCPPFKTENISIEDEERLEVRKWINMTGLYMYDGKLAGLYSRVARNKVIGSYFGERPLATRILCEE